MWSWYIGYVDSVSFIVLYKGVLCKLGILLIGFLDLYFFFFLVFDKYYFVRWGG